MLKRTLLILLLAIITRPAIQAIAANGPTLPEQPRTTKQEADFQAAWQWVSEPTNLYEYAGSRDQSPLGVGHLRGDHTDDGYYDWPRKIIMQ